MNAFYLIILFFISDEKNFCSCIPLGPIDEKQYNEYDFIARGKIVNIKETRFQRLISFQVDTIYRGKDSRTIVEIISPKGSGECGIFPEKGENWLMFTYTSSTSYKTYLCTRTKSMKSGTWDYNKDELKNDLEFLRAKINK